MFQGVKTLLCGMDGCGRLNILGSVTSLTQIEHDWLYGTGMFLQLLFSRFNVRRDEQWALTTILELSRNVRTHQHTENVLV